MGNRSAGGPHAGDLPNQYVPADGILRAQIFLADLADFPGMNSVWDTWVVAGHTPARATVQAKLANPAWKVEIKIVAAVSASKA